MDIQPAFGTRRLWEAFGHGASTRLQHFNTHVTTS